MDEKWKDKFKGLIAFICTLRIEVTLKTYKIHSHDLVYLDRQTWNLWRMSI